MTEKFIILGRAQQLDERNENVYVYKQMYVCMFKLYLNVSLLLCNFCCTK